MYWVFWLFSYSTIGVFFKKVADTKTLLFFFFFLGGGGGGGDHCNSDKKYLILKPDTTVCYLVSTAQILGS